MKKLLLYSGGYDSVALLDYLLKSEDTTNLTVLYESGREIQSELEEKKAKNAYRYLIRKHKRDNLKVTWKTQNIDLNWIAGDKRSEGGDILLSIHIMSALLNCPYNKIYTGWHKHRLKLSFANKLLKWFNSIKDEKVSLYFMEDVFVNSISAESCKSLTISYLLENNIFHLPYSSDSRETEEEYKERDTWYKWDNKEMQLSTAIASLNVFKNGKMLARAFSCKDTISVQKLYNDLTKKDHEKKLLKEK